MGVINEQIGVSNFPRVDLIATVYHEAVLRLTVHHEQCYDSQYITSSAMTHSTSRALL